MGFLVLVAPEQETPEFKTAGGNEYEQEEEDEEVGREKGGGEREEGGMITGSNFLQLGWNSSRGFRITNANLAFLYSSRAEEDIFSASVWRGREVVERESGYSW